MLDLLRGLNVPPWVVGFARGGVETAALAALGALALYISDSEFSSEMWIGFVWWIIRTLEGFADQIDPSKSRR